MAGLPRVPAIINENNSQLQHRKWVPSLFRDAPNSGGTGAAASRRAIADEFLDAFSAVHFGCVDVAFAVQAYLMQPVKLTGVAARASQPPQLLQIAAVEHIDGHV